MRGTDSAGLIDRKDLDRTLDIAHVDRAAIGGKDQSCEAGDGFGVGFEVVGGCLIGR